jgi:hypothetical protein
MSERTRDVLRPEFKDGERPSGNDFADLIDSCVNKSSDGVTVDPDGTFAVLRGLRLGNSTVNIPGGLRFDSGQVQFNNGTSWQSIGSGGGGAFQTIAPSMAAFNGSVGIGAFNSTTLPSFKFEVNLAAGTAPAEQVRFGNAVISNGTAASSNFAMFSHQSHASNSNYAIRQNTAGVVHINAPASTVVSIRQGGSSVRLGVSQGGNVIIGSETDLTGAPATALFQVAGDAFKTTGASWNTSDARIKEDIRDLDVGLAELCQVRPVRFRYNGLAGTPAGREAVGVIGQEIEKVLPDTVQHVPWRIEGKPVQDDLRVFDSSPLTFVLVNAVKELAARVERLEQELAAARRPGE